MPLALYTTLDDAEAAGRIVREAVSRGLAACVHAAPVHSVFRWNGRIEEAAETRLMFKVSEAGVDALADFVAEVHPYDEPAIWAVAMTQGSESFFRWIEENSASVE